MRGKEDVPSPWAEFPVAEPVAERRFGAPSLGTGQL